MSTPQQLTLEQQFAIARFNSVADKMSHEQAISFLKDLYLSYEVQRATYNELLKHEWGLHGSNQRSAGEESQG